MNSIKPFKLMDYFSQSHAEENVKWFNVDERIMEFIE